MRQHYIVPKPSFGQYACYPDMLGHYSQLPQHAERRESGQMRHYNLHLVFGGSGYVVDGGSGTRVELKAGEGFLFGRHAFQQYRASAREPWDIRWIHFDAHIPLPMLSEADDCGSVLFTFSEHDRFKQLTEEMYMLCEPFGIRHEPRLSALLYEILVELVQHSERLAGLQSLEKQNVIRRTADQIRQRSAEGWTLERMAELAGYSSFHFLRLFQQVMGKTPNRFVTECRIDAAKLLLATTACSVTEAAALSGFAQPSYFIKVFRAAVGLSPKKYRTLYGQGLPDR